MAFCKALSIFAFLISSLLTLTLEIWALSNFKACSIKALSPNSRTSLMILATTCEVCSPKFIAGRCKACSLCALFSLS